jgi:hypothetical protein
MIGSHEQERTKEFFAVSVNESRVPSTKDQTEAGQDYIVTIPQLLQEICPFTSRQYMIKSGTINVLIVIMQQHNLPIFCPTSKQCMRRSETRSVPIVTMQDRGPSP